MGLRDVLGEQSLQINFRLQAREWEPIVSLFPATPAFASSAGIGGDHRCRAAKEHYHAIRIFL
jgi:hypothetical protein